MNEQVNEQVIFDIENVSRRFGNSIETEVWALRGVDLKIKKGEFTALIGPSGSGKSTLLNIISGLDRATEGEVYLEGKLISNMNDKELSAFRRDHIGFVFQAFNLIPVLSVKENIEYVMVLQGAGAEERKQKVHEILKLVGLEGMEHRLPSQLSGGQQQRVAVARAMVSEPNIILADEPTANLDSKSGGDLINIMLDLNEKFQKTFVFSTHDPKIIAKAKRVVTLTDGKITSDETR